MKLTFACAQRIRTQIAKSFQKILYILGSVEFTTPQSDGPTSFI